MRSEQMTTREDLFAARLAKAIEARGGGARLSASSTRSGVAGGNTGTLGDLSTQAKSDGSTQIEWLMGDPWTDDYFFKPYNSLTVRNEAGDL